MATLPLLLFTIFLYAEVSCEICDSASWASVETLLSVYARDAAPAPAPVTVHLSLNPRHASVEARPPAMRVLTDLNMEWNDSRLSWNVSDWGCDTALVPAELLWLPDIVLLNAAGAETGALQRARVSSSGSVLWIQRLDATVPLTMALEDWPRDLQTGQLTFASRQHTVDEIKVKVKEMKYVTVHEHGGWEVQQVVGAELLLQAADGNRGAARWTIAVQRRAPAHLAAARAQLAAAALLLLAAAILPPAKRPPLAAAASFTAAMWLTWSLSNVSGGSASPMLVRLMCAVCACGAAVALAAAAALRLARRRAAPPGVLRALLTAVAGFCNLTPLETSSEGTDMGADAGAGGAAWGAAARLLDYTLLAVLLLALFVIVCLAA